jgi:hypothetical protein
MRRFTGAIAAPIMAGLFMAVAGCGTAAASASGASHSAALTHGGGSHTGAMAPVGPLSSPARTKPPVGAQSSVAKAFPGIWDITTWQAYRAAQTSVMQGHQPWLLDPELVVQAWAASQWSPAPTVHRIAADSFEVTKPGTNIIYTVRGTCPDPASAAPIWVITAISHS